MSEKEERKEERAAAPHLWSTMPVLWQQEQERRVYYQNIVYDVCRQLDPYGGLIQCGTADSPSTEVQTRLAEALKSRRDPRLGELALQIAPLAAKQATLESRQLELLAECQAKNERLQHENDILRRERAGEVWIWQGDEYDHPESLTCPVLIQPDALRMLLAERDAAMRACYVLATPGEDDMASGLLRVAHAADLARKAVHLFAESDSPPFADDEREELERLRSETKTLREIGDKISAALAEKHGRYDGKTLLDFQQVWLDQARAEAERLQVKLAQQLSAVKEHRDQHADDKCWMDDDKLYAAFGLPSADKRVGDPEAMLENCRRYIQQRCIAGGPWKSYAELEADVERLNQMLRDAGQGQGAIDAYTAQCEELDRLQKIVEQFTRGVTCFSCHVEWTPERDEERCDCAHREEWPHEWVSRRVIDVTNKCCEHLDTIEELREQLAGMTEARNRFCSYIGKIALALGFPERDAYSPDAVLRRAAKVMDDLRLREGRAEQGSVS